MPDIDVLAEQFVSGQPSGCMYMDAMAEAVRNGEISIDEMKATMRESLDSVV
jgi:hypothetical protein